MTTETLRPTPDACYLNVCFGFGLHLSRITLTFYVLRFTFYAHPPRQPRHLDRQSLLRRRYLLEAQAHDFACFVDDDEGVGVYVPHQVCNGRQLLLAHGGEDD